MESDHHPKREGPDDLLLKHAALFRGKSFREPVLDLACGNGHNGVFLGTLGLKVVLADVSEEALAQAEALALRHGVSARIWRVDLEKGGRNPLDSKAYSAVLVFRYLHRPLIPWMKKALIRGGLLFYETYTEEQAQFGKPKNPDHLLRSGELLEWFKDWEVIHSFEGITGHPKNAIAQIVCRKPGG